MDEILKKKCENAVQLMDLDPQQLLIIKSFIVKLTGEEEKKEDVHQGHVDRVHEFMGEENSKLEDGPRNFT